MSNGPGVPFSAGSCSLMAAVPPTTGTSAMRSKSHWGAQVEDNEFDLQ